MSALAGTPGRNGLAEAQRRRREWDERPLHWWDADGHKAERARLGIPTATDLDPNGDEDA